MELAKMNERELLAEISQDIKKLLGIMATQNMADDKKILTLQKMDFNSTQISAITGIPEQTVRNKWKKKGKS